MEKSTENYVRFKLMGRNLRVKFFLVITFFLAFVKPVWAADVFSDNFENGLGNWQITALGNAVVNTALDTDPGSTHGNILHVYYPGNNSDIKIILKNLTSLIYGKSNLVYEVDFYDDPARDYGISFYVRDASGRYLEFIVDSLTGNYRLRNDYGAQSKYFDTRISRKLGWHKIQIIVSSAGAYLVIDGQNSVYLRGQIAYPNVSEIDFPIFNGLTGISEVGIEYPAWNKPAGNSYWDNFRIYELRPQAKTTSQKEEDLILEYLNSYESNLGNANFLNAETTLKGIQNFQLSRLGLAAAYGVRYSAGGDVNDLANLKKYLTAVINDYWAAGGWKGQQSETPISGQVIAAIASWQWSNLDTTLRNKISGILNDIGTNTNKNNCISSMAAGYDNNQISDSRGEEFAWIASYLKFVSDVYQDKSDTPSCGVNDPALTKWSVRAANFACVSTTHALATDPTKIDPGDICTSNQAVMPPNPSLTSAFIMRNHGIDHPGYALTIAWGLAQAQLYQLNQGKTESQIETDYRRNFGNFYTNNISNLVRFNNYSYKPLTPADMIFAYTGKDDWDQDATLQDQAWAYFDIIFKNRPGWNWTNKLDGIVNYAWLTRGGKAFYPPLVDGDLAAHWLEPEVISCGPGSCNAYKMNSALYFFLNSMDAIDRFETLFIINPSVYPLHLICTPSTSCGTKNCGTIPDGCGGTLNCGPTTRACTAAFGTCSVTGTQSCQVDNTYSLTCTATDPRTANCVGKNCGTDGCGGVCGTCTLPQVCGGGGTPNVCAPLPGDLNGDGKVNITDLKQLLSSFTNIFNYNLVVANFGETQ